MRFDNRTISPEITEAIKIAENLLLPDSKMMLELKFKNDWRYNSGSGEDVFKNLQLRQAPLKVFTYRPVNPWSKAFGYFDGFDMHINLRKLPFMTVKDIVGNLLHEYSHYSGFNHGTGRLANYYTRDKGLYSVPYYISDNIEKWV